jgi:hypothetical protein
MVPSFCKYSQHCRWLCWHCCLLPPPRAVLRKSYVGRCRCWLAGPIGYMMAAVLAGWLGGPRLAGGWPWSAGRSCSCSAQVDNIGEHLALSCSRDNTEHYAVRCNRCSHRWRRARRTLFVRVLVPPQHSVSCSAAPAGHHTPRWQATPAPAIHAPCLSAIRPCRSQRPHCGTPT